LWEAIGKRVDAQRSRVIDETNDEVIKILFPNGKSDIPHDGKAIGKELFAYGSIPRKFWSPGQQDPQKK
jgi:hypothetical protein